MVSCNYFLFSDIQKAPPLVSGSATRSSAPPTTGRSRGISKAGKKDIQRQTGRLVLKTDEGLFEHIAERAFRIHRVPHGSFNSLVFKQFPHSVNYFPFLVGVIEIP